MLRLQHVSGSDECPEQFPDGQSAIGMLKEEIEVSIPGEIAEADRLPERVDGRGVQPGGTIGACVICE